MQDIDGPLSILTTISSFFFSLATIVFIIYFLASGSGDLKDAVWALDLGLKLLGIGTGFFLLPFLIVFVKTRIMEPSN